MPTVIGSTTEYGTYLYHQAIYRDNAFIFDVGTISLSVEEVELRFYNARGEIGRVSTGTRDSALGKVKFEYLPTGCGKMDFTLLNPPPFSLEPGMRVDIHAFRDPRPWYSGLVLNRPALGSTDRNLRFEGHGFFNSLENIVLHNSDGLKNTVFQNTEIATIVTSLFQSFIAPLGTVIFNPGKIVPVGYIAIETDFEFATAKQAFEDLAALALNYEVGVDENRSFFFRPILDTIQFTRFVKKHADVITIEENFADMANRIYVKHALTVNSQTVHNIIIAEDTTSQAVYGLRERNLTAPSVVNTIDAARWAQFKLDEVKKPIRKARLKGTDLTTKFIVQGNARIFGLKDTLDYSDEFNVGVILDGRWRTEKNRSSGTASDSIIILDGFLRTTILKYGSTINTLYHNMFAYQSIQGDFEIVTHMASPSGNSAQHGEGDSQGIHIRDDKKNWLIIGTTNVASSIERQRGRIDTNSMVSVETLTGSWNLRGDIYLRARREGDIFRAWSGTDGVNWIQMTDPTTPFRFSGPVQAGVMVSDGIDTAVVGRLIKFDFFRVDKFAEPYSLPIKKITYEWSNKQRKVDMELGDFKESFDKEFIELSREIQTQELLQEKV